MKTMKETLIEMVKTTDDPAECQMVAKVIGGGYYQPNYERFNRIYSAQGVSPTIATRCDRFSSFWISESYGQDESNSNIRGER